MTQKTSPVPQAFSEAKRPAIQLANVESSQVKAIGYDAAQAADDQREFAALVLAIRKITDQAAA